MTAPTPAASLRDRIAAAILARIKQAVVHPGRPLFGGGTEHLLAANEYDLADVVLPLVAAEWEAERREAASLLADLTDPDPCRYDHHGYCQAHGWFAVEPSCPHARAKARADAEDGAR